VRKLWKVATIVGAGVLALPALAAAPAVASPPTGYSFDNTPHVIVGGGSDTTYRAMVGITSLYNATTGCAVVTAVGPTLNTCSVPSPNNPETNTLGNYQHDTVGQAYPAGSGAGIASLNCAPGTQASIQYYGAANPNCTFSGTSYPNVDFARSSRAPKTSGGNISGGNELTGDTFWGFAQDGIEVGSFNNRGTFLQSKAGAGALTPTEIFHIWNCDYTTWSQVPSLGIAPGAANDGPIIVFGMNSSSGTYGTMNTWVINNAVGAPSTFTVNAKPCDHALSTGLFSFENDVKPILNDVAANGIDGSGPGLSNSASAHNNPENFIWFSSFGEMSAFPHKSSTTISGTKYQFIASPINGVLPSTSNIINNTYPIGRTLYHVTLKTDADCPKTSGSCDFVGNPGPALPGGGTDLGMAGASSGKGGAVLEFTRFICRASAAQQSIDSYTGLNLFNEITSAINQAGYTTVPFSLRSSGSRCAVLS
jgi:hypothetical protein